MSILSPDSSAFSSSSDTHGQFPTKAYLKLIFVRGANLIIPWFSDEVAKAKVTSRVLRDKN